MTLSYKERKNIMLAEAVAVLEQENKMDEVHGLGMKLQVNQVIASYKAYNNGSLFYMTTLLTHQFMAPTTTNIEVWEAMTTKERLADIEAKFYGTEESERGAYNMSESTHLNIKKQSGETKRKRDARNREIAKIKRELEGLE